jgi:hypothetical protein
VGIAGRLCRRSQRLKVIDDALLAQMAEPGRCEWCASWCVRREAHHCRARGTGSHKRVDAPLNLIALGSSADFHPCHTILHAGGCKEKVLAIVAMREGVTPEEITNVMNLIIRLPKASTPEQIHREAADLTTSEQALLWKSLGWAEKKARRA